MIEEPIVVTTEKIEEATEVPAAETKQVEESATVPEPDKAEEPMEEVKVTSDAAEATESASETVDEEKIFSEGGYPALLKHKTWRMWESVSETVTSTIGRCPGSPGN